MPRSFDQIRAERAYSVAANCQAVDGFKETAQAFPAMLQTNGLLAGVAFLLAKRGKPKYDRVAEAVVAHLRDTTFGLNVGPAGTPIEVFRYWVGTGAAGPNVTGPDLQHLSEEALAFAGWLKRAAEAHGGDQE
jgi:CRISPR/Cas system CMR-associated protein Cmr5 small subunit